MSAPHIFSDAGFGSPKRRDYRSHVVSTPQDARPATPALKTGRPSKDRYLGKIDGDFLFRMELAKYARQQAAIYMREEKLAALHEVLWACATRFFPQHVISYMKREIMIDNITVAYVQRDALNTLQELLPCFLAEYKGNTLRLTVPPQGETDLPPDLNIIDRALDADALLAGVTARTLCQDAEALSAVDLMSGEDLADLIIDATPCLADEAWETYAERLLKYAPAMTGRLREVVAEKLMMIPAVNMTVAPDSEEAE